MSDIECSVASRLVETPMVNACDNHHTDLGLPGTVKKLVHSCKFVLWLVSYSRQINREEEERTYNNDQTIQTNGPACFCDKC